MQLARWAVVAKETGAEPPVRLGVISVHGMATTGRWQKDINGCLFDNDIRHEPVDYGFKLVPLSVNEVVEKILAKEAAQRASGVHRISAIAHSLGSLALGATLERNPSFVLHRLILWGCILPKDFNWLDVKAKAQLDEVLHERCERDPWPRIAKYAFKHLGAGETGRHGFDQTPGMIHDVRYEGSGHSNLGTEMHCAKTWVPFLLNGVLPPGASTQ